MNYKIAAITASITLTLFNQSLLATELVKQAANGIKLPTDYKNWRVISISHRTDNNSLRTILGNNIAVKAARSGNTNPWPQGSILGKVVWKQKTEEHWPTAIAPDKFVHAEFMIKDSIKYKSTGGWGYARWLGEDQKPYGADEDFALECMSCHTPVKDNDWVFTTPAVMP
ncbi:MAG: cytochrome P460 family protein [Gammaproteobacteria bacterium]|nr:cytochrome P460 family protein [Gammaproteobacteria bacterium]